MTGATRNVRPTRDAPVLSVVVPAHDAAGTLPATLAALAGQEVDVGYEVIVVDDGSTTMLPPPCRRVRREPGQGAWEARNTGAAAARGRALAFTDADCIPTAGWLAAGLRALERADLVQGAVAPDPRVGLGPFDRSLWVSRETGLYETANLFVRRNVFERIGGFQPVVDMDVSRERPFGEDSLLGWRARRGGARTAFCPEAVVHHAVFKSGPIAYLVERLRLQHFPALAQKVPEIRRTLFFGGLFLSRRTALFDLALAGTLIAGAARRRAPLAAALPYAALLLRRAFEWGRPAPRVGLEVLAVDPIADVVAFASLMRGSVRRRTPVF